ncbi:MAG: FixH family protein [Zoogloeaceae bacterium]|jgi:hypothetical protein|nr:FixH family protein [Zoogloeaceae bacterium]
MTTTTADSLMRVRRPWYKEPWPWFLMGLPATAVVAGIATLIIATKTSDSLVEDDYYKQGLGINQQLHRDQAASKQGMGAQLLIEDKEVRLFLQSNAGMTTGEKLVLHLNHPTLGGKDQVITLEPAGAGFYSGLLTEPIIGKRHVILEDANKTWRLQGIWQKDSNSLELSARAREH